MTSKNETTSNAPTENDTSNIRIKFIFANRDGVHVELECPLSDTVGSITKALQSKWPEEIGPTAPSVDRIRLICMGKGILSPATKTIESCEIPNFLTHPTPVNVSVKPIITNQKKSFSSGHSSAPQRSSGSNNASQGECCCIIS